MGSELECVKFRRNERIRKEQSTFTQREVYTHIIMNVSVLLWFEINNNKSFNIHKQPRIKSLRKKGFYPLGFPHAIV